jgi:hypothetical protein
MAVGWYLRLWRDQTEQPRLRPRLLMKLQFGQDARLLPGTKVMVNGARAREQSGGSRRHTGNRFAAGKR